MEQNKRKIYPVESSLDSVGFLFGEDLPMGIDRSTNRVIFQLDQETTDLISSGIAKLGIVVYDNKKFEAYKKAELEKFVPDAQVLESLGFVKRTVSLHTPAVIFQKKINEDKSIFFNTNDKTFTIANRKEQSETNLTDTNPGAVSSKEALEQTIKDLDF